MLTPRFSLSQDEKFIFINIHAPFIKITEADCYATDDEFYFHAQPYYLRLHLPGEVVDDEHSASHSQYDTDKGQLTVRLLKKVCGQWFEGLDLLTKLLTPKKVDPSKCTGVEVITHSNFTNTEKDIDAGSSRSYSTHDDEESKGNQLNFEFDWFVEQKVHNQEASGLNLEGPKYGFAQKKSAVLKDITSDLTSMLDIKNPDSMPEKERRSLRLHQEKEAFNCEHYLADYFDDEAIQESILLSFEDLVGDCAKLSEREQYKLTTLPSREYMIDKSELKSVYLGLVDLIYAYAFNYRFTNGEENVESDWTICKLSATLSWLDHFDDIKEVVLSCARRSLCFPLFRNWKLIQRVLQDVQCIFQNGKTNVLKCLLGIYFIISESESRYPLNDLYVIDYCVWVQSSDANHLKSIADTLENMQLSKSDLDFNLEDMEREAAKLMLSDSDNEEMTKEVETLSTTLSNVVHIKGADSGTGPSDSDDESDDESEETDSSSSCESNS
ncbi:hypothetical protein RRG08_015950 [Elysia crispata]|uniref:Protein SHQ1 homolog n=1 Tax=Elysia crispata TaxID=231223 RepID=A0AAE1ANM7_9GAST|nr:hypothetical protein RRG08_015950 [Elysia crispata]